MTVESCEECRGIFHLLKGAGGTSARTSTRLPPILESAPKVSDIEQSPSAPLDERTQKLVNLRRAYERKLPETDENTVEHEHQRGIITGITLSIGVLRGAGIEIDDPQVGPSRPRARARESSARPVSENGKLSVMTGALLGILVARGKSTSKELLGVLSGYAPSGPFNSAMKSLRDAEFIEGSGQITATAKGRDMIKAAPKLLHGDALLMVWVAKLGVMEGELLSAIVSIARAREGRIDHEEIQSESGYRPSGPYNGGMKRLRNTNLIVTGTNRPIAELLR